MATVITDHDLLVQLNDDYIRSVQQGDVQRFRDILDAGFTASLGDGSVVDKTAFLDVTARPVAIRNLQAHDVRIHVVDDVAVIHGKTTFTTLDGRAGTGRYTDVWRRLGGQWLAVSAHVTRQS